MASSGPSTCRTARTSLAYCLHGAAYDDVDLYVMINAGPTDADFGIHEGTVGSWRRVIDTAQESPDDILEPGRDAVVTAPRCRVEARSVVALVRKHGASPAI